MTTATQLWQEVLVTALVGTSKQPPHLPAPSSTNDALAQTLAHLATQQRDKPEQALLSAAAALTLYQQAGQRPPNSPTPPPEPAPPDDGPLCTPRAAQHLGAIVQDDRRDAQAGLLREWLQGASRCGQRVPAEHLVALLEAGEHTGDLRDAILPVLGERGRWLARQNPRWDYATPTLQRGVTDEQRQQVQAAWETGTRDARRTLLRQMRRTNPDLARDLLVSTWRSEALNDRKAFIEYLADGLSSADEPFLESALDDRSKDVRHSAAGLLARLPDSQLVQRMIARVDPLLEWVNGSLVKTAEIRVTLPDACDKAMERDGIEPKPPRRNLGEKSWWLRQMLGAIPPTHWNTRWNQATYDLVKAALLNKSDWRGLLLEGLIRAVVRHENAEWAGAILHIAASDEQHEHLIPLLSPADFATYLNQALKQHKRDLSHPLRFITLNPHPLSEPAARALLEAMRREQAQDDTQSFRNANTLQYNNVIQEYALRVPPHLADELDKGWKTSAKHWEIWHRSIRKMVELVTFRREMIKEFTV